GGGGDEPRKIDLVSVRLDGTDKQRHLRFLQAEDAVPSPDGAWVAYVSRDDVWVTPMPRAGSAPVEIAPEKGAGPVCRLSTEGGGYIGWADGGRALVWGMGGTIYRQRLDVVRDFAIKKAAEAKKKEAEATAGGDQAKKDDARQADAKEADEGPKPEA